MFADLGRAPAVSALLAGVGGPVPGLGGRAAAGLLVLAAAAGMVCGCTPRAAHVAA